jgi:hypothetical protein
MALKGTLTGEGLGSRVRFPRIIGAACAASLRTSSHNFGARFKASSCTRLTGVSIWLARDHRSLG